MCQWMIWKIKGQDKFGYKSWLRLISLTEWWGSGLYAENLYSSKTKMRSFKKKTLLILKIALILREEAGEGTERMPSFPPQTPGQHGCNLQDHFCVILCEHIKGRQRRRLPHALGHCLGALETVEIWNFLYKGKMPWCHCPFKNGAYRPDRCIFTYYDLFCKQNMYETNAPFRLDLTRDDEYILQFKWTLNSINLSTRRPYT